MKARMKNNLIMHYQQCEEFNYKSKGFDYANELQAIKALCGSYEYMRLKQFLKSIEGKVVDLVFTHGDAFEVKDNDVWLPGSLWDKCDG